MSLHKSLYFPFLWGMPLLRTVDAALSWPRGKQQYWTLQLKQGSTDDGGKYLIIRRSDGALVAKGLLQEGPPPPCLSFLVPPMSCVSDCRVECWLGHLAGPEGVGYVLRACRGPIFHEDVQDLRCLSVCAIVVY